MPNASAQKEFALKKIRCPTGADGVEVVMREVTAYRRFKCVLNIIVYYLLFIPCFRHPNIIRLYVRETRFAGMQKLMLTILQDSAVLQDTDGEGKIAYLFLPIYKARSPAFLVRFRRVFLTCLQCSAETYKTQ